MVKTRNRRIILALLAIVVVTVVVAQVDPPLVGTSLDLVNGSDQTIILPTSTSNTYLQSDSGTGSTWTSALSPSSITASTVTIGTCSSTETPSGTWDIVCDITFGDGSGSTVLTFDTADVTDPNITGLADGSISTNTDWDFGQDITVTEDSTFESDLLVGTVAPSGNIKIGNNGSTNPSITFDGNGTDCSIVQDTAANELFNTCGQFQGGTPGAPTPMGFPSGLQSDTDVTIGDGTDPAPDVVFDNAGPNDCTITANNSDSLLLDNCPFTILSDDLTVTAGEINATGGIIDFDGGAADFKTNHTDYEFKGVLGLNTWLKLESGVCTIGDGTNTTALTTSATGLAINDDVTLSHATELAGAVRWNVGGTLLSNVTTDLLELDDTARNAHPTSSVDPDFAVRHIRSTTAFQTYTIQVTANAQFHMDVGDPKVNNTTPLDIDCQAGPGGYKNILTTNDSCVATLGEAAHTTFFGGPFNAGEGGIMEVDTNPIEVRATAGGTQTLVEFSNAIGGSSYTAKLMHESGLFELQCWDGGTPGSEVAALTCTADDLAVTTAFGTATLASAPFSCTSGKSGRLYTDTTSDPDTLCFCNGTEWVDSAAGPDVPLTFYEGEPPNVGEQNVHGGWRTMDTGETISSGDSPVETAGIGKIVLVVNAGLDTSGTITVTGTSVNRSTGAETGSDTDTFVISGTTTDTSSTGSCNSETILGFSNAYISGKWFTGSVTFSTSDVNVSDLDIYQVAFEQFNDSSNVTLETLDITAESSNSTADMCAHLYSVVPGAGDTVTIAAEKSITYTNVTASRPIRARRTIGTALDGATDGVFLQMFFEPTASFWSDITGKVWFSKSGDCS